ncbi:uncharacterized protein LOC143191518 [Rhynchophorus ferrugineus]|uniref:uncharacterized protein LOC143191518 n=1 Tax=Rhynchophorus ferrugineus TaxID=354439 RepID=UPI003FCD2754
MEDLKEQQRKLIGEVSAKNGFLDYEVIAKTVASEGDGYMGNLIGLNIVDRHSDRKLCLVMKTASDNEKLRRMIPTREMFLREMYYYETVFPELMKFQEKYHISEPFKSIPPYYGSVKDDRAEAILLGNIKENQYKMVNRREPMDGIHLTAVIKEYARIHALSFAMHKLEPELFAKLTEPIKLNVMVEFEMKNQEKGQKSNMTADSFNTFFELVFQALEGRDKELAAFRRYAENAFQFMLIFFSQPEKCNIISHTDCWSTNMLFKYEDESKPDTPTKVCLIDWQLASLSFAVFDIAYFFYICAGKEDLHKYKSYLDIYHSTLSDRIRDFGLDPLEMYPVEVFEKDWKEYSKWGIFMTIMMLPQSLSEGKTHDFEKMAENGENIAIRKHKMTDEFKKRITDLIEFVVEQDLL